MASSTIHYLDSSAVVKLVIEEVESEALRRHLGGGGRIITSEVAIVEVPRAATVADPAAETRQRARELLEEVDLVRVDRPLLEEASELASPSLRTLDAIHLASAISVEPSELVAYDARLASAARRAGLTVAAPA